MRGDWSTAPKSKLDGRLPQGRDYQAAVADLTERAGGKPLSADMRALVEHGALLRVLLLRLTRDACEAEKPSAEDARTVAQVSRQYLTVVDRIGRGGRPDRRHERHDKPAPPVNMMAELAAMLRGDG